MADRSFGRRRHTTPARSEYGSTSFSTSSSYIFPQFRGLGRGANATPASPFATDDDKSWKGELSWQFEPSGWQENRNFGAAFSPWATNSAATARSNIFKRSANDYFLSHTYGGVQSFEHSHQDFSLGRLELQSYVARGSNGGSRPNASPILTSIREGSGGSSLMDRDETSTVDHGLPQDMDRQIRLIKTYRDLKQEQDPRWFSVSHAYMNENEQKSHDHRRHHHQVGGVDDLESANYSHHHHSMPAVVEDDDDDDDEDEAVAPRTVGLFGLFRYAVMLDFVLILFGSLGALINGGSLPFYSLLFGRFVNKLALGGTA